jgi:hypothetical protein
MKNFITFIRKFITKNQSTQLGRWNIDYCRKKIDNKVDLANEDHCGPCGQYIIVKKEESKNNEFKKH